MLRPSPEAAPATPPPAVAPAPHLGAKGEASDTGLLRTLAADSVQDEKDMAMLDELHDVAAAESETEVSLSALFDINVARYSEHPRVKFYLDFFQTRARERMAIWLERLPVYEPMIHTALAAHSLPRDLLYLALIESGYSNTAVSRSRAVGMWQFMRPTAREYGLRVDSWVDERRDPVKATLSATRYLADLTRRFSGSHYLAAAAYNGGGGRVSRGLRMLGAGAEVDYFDPADFDGELAADSTGDDRFFHLSESRYLHQETKDYVPKLIAAAMIAKQPEKYGFAPIPEVEPYAYDSVAVAEPTSLEVVAKVSGAESSVITGLNPHFLRNITPPGSATWWVRVPVGTGPAAVDALAALPSAERLPMLSHTVRANETLRTVGRRYGMTATEVARYNPEVGSGALKRGTVLKIPGIARLRDAGSGSGVHVVRRGETPGGIAQRYGMSLSQLQRLNGLKSRSIIRVGQRIRVSESGPSRASSSESSNRTAATSHLVRRGDTLSAISRRYGVSVQRLLAANGLRTASALKAGQRISIPN
ncbi:MAG: lytic transglycosylase domain-containing protein [Gemmatimonadales bacterium]